MKRQEENAIAVDCSRLQSIAVDSLGGAAFSRANDEPQRGSMSVAPDCPKGYRGKTAKKVLNPRGVPCSFLSHRLRQGTWNPYGVHVVSCFPPPVAASPQPGATNRQPLRGCKNEAQKQGGFQRWGEASPPSRERETRLLPIAVDCSRLQAIAVAFLGGAAFSRANALCDLLGGRP